MKDQHAKQIAIFGVVAAVLMAAAGTAKVAAQATGGPETLPSGTPSAAPSSSPSATPTVAAAGQEAVYAAQLSAIGTISNGASATVSFVKQGNNVGAIAQGSALAPNIPHILNVHAGTVCPSTSSDTNGDGIVDSLESDAVTGPAVVALTLTPGTLAAPVSGYSNNQYPYASPQGNLLYGNSGPLTTFLQALAVPSGVPSVLPSAIPSVFPSAIPSVFPSSQPAAAAASDVLANLAGHVVVIRGVDASTTLPSTVQSSDAATTAAQALPVACGVIQRQPD